MSLSLASRTRCFTPRNPGSMTTKEKSTGHIPCSSSIRWRIKCWRSDPSSLPKPKLLERIQTALRAGTCGRGIAAP